MKKKIKNKKNPRISVLFQMDSFENLDFDTDTTLNLIQEALKINADVWVGYPKKLTYSDGKASITAQKIVSSDLSFGKPKNLKIDEFDFYFIRQDPPFNMSYLTNCYLLELHKSFNKKPFFVNDPSGIKNFTEKIFPLFFSEHMPKSLVTEDEMIFLKMLRKHKYLVIKTLYNKGGEGVVKVSDENEKKAIKEFNNIKKRYSVPVVVQEFLDEVVYGDKRVILIDGKAAGVINRIPKKGQFKAKIFGPTSESNTDADAVQDTFVQQRGFKENRLGETADTRELQKNGVLDEPISKPKEVSPKGDTTKRGASSFYGDE